MSSVREKPWHKGERMSLDELRRLQLKRLRWSLRWATRVSFIRKKWRETEVDVEEIKTLEDLEKLPFMTMKDFIDNFPFGLLAVPLEDVVRLHMSSGTTGNPKVVAYTAKDLKVWTLLMARSLACVGLTRRDVFVNTSNHNIFTGGLGIIQGAEMIGATTIPLGPVGSERTIELLRELKATALHAIPSFGLRLAEVAKKLGIIPEKDLFLRVGVFGAEPWSEQTRRRIEDGLGVTAFDNYGLSELCGPGVAVECEYRNGLHVWSDYFVPEVIDPSSGERVGDGEEGELVLTALWKEAIPIVRFRTGDLCSITYEPCECGRVHPRISRIRGRRDDMLIIRGTNVFPSQIEEVVMSFPETTDSFQAIIWKEGPMDEIVVKVEIRDENWRQREEIKRKIERKLRDLTFLRMTVECVKENTLPRPTGKARRIIDKRVH